MFSYSNNNSVNMVDIGGTDAIWIQENSSAAGFGHSGLIVQAENGNWYYFFWGASSGGDFSSSSSSGTDANVWLIQLDTSGLDMSTYSGVWMAMIREKKPRKRIPYVTGLYYFEGDYDNTYQYLADLVNNQSNESQDREKYSLLSNNCVQVCCTAMRCSNSSFKNCRSTIPNSLELTIVTLADQWLRPNYLWDLPNPVHNYNVLY